MTKAVLPQGVGHDSRRIRNYAIIAHIDHGKSTLADQFLLKTGAITAREFRNQVLDDMDLERERGITIQMHPVTIYHQHQGQTYELNLIDTPGHVDFNYEVSRSLAACEGVILLVDAFQGVQAQTVANAYLAMESDLTIVPVLNKIDLPIARPDDVIAEMESALGIDPADVLRCSGKTGLGIDEMLQAIIDRVPAPAGNVADPLKALVYNSHFDTYKGVVVYVRIKEGALRKGQRIKLMRGGTEHEVTDIGQFRPAMTAVRGAGGRPGRLLHGPDQEPRRRPHRRHRHRRPEPNGDRPGRLQGAQADGVQRPLSDQQQRLRDPARGPGQAAAQRFQLQLPARDQRGARFRLPLRLSGHAPSRDHPAAPGTRQRPRPGANRPERDLRDPHAQGRDPGHRQPAKGARRGPDRGVPRAVRAASAFLLPSSNIGDIMQMCTERRGDLSCAPST